jgi:hypothetical protein
MTSTRVSTPLHHRHECVEAVDAVPRRYKTFRQKLGKQVYILQKSAAFRTQCSGLYQRGYKDWMILGAVFNYLLQAELQKRGVDISNGQRSAAIAKELSEDSSLVFETCDADELCGDRFIQFLYTFNMVALASYGFELRRRTFDPGVVEKFLRERLGHFSLDVQHDPLFGAPPGDWPEV